MTSSVRTDTILATIPGHTTPSSVVIPLCDQTNEDQSKAYRVVTSITKSTTAAAFDATRAEHPDYEFSLGGRLGWLALEAAAAHDNVPLIQHIVTVGGKALLHLSGRSTPLHCAAGRGHLEAVRALIELGAHVNCCFGERPYRTPLCSALFSGDVVLVTYMIDQGGIVDANLPFGTERITDTYTRATTTGDVYNRALNYIKKRNQVSAGIIRDASLNILLPEVCGIIAQYLQWGTKPPPPPTTLTIEEQH